MQNLIFNPWADMQRSSSFSVNDCPINGYRIVEPIGEGPFGEVWKAVRTKTQVMVALKIIDISANPGFMKTLPHLKKIRKLENSQLLTIFTARLLDRNGREYRLDDLDRITAGVRRIVVASWLGEFSLADRLAKEKQRGGGFDRNQGIPFEELIDYMKSAASGLDFMNRPPLPIKENEGPFVHGDVKPSNLIVLAGNVLLSDNYQLFAVPTSTTPGSPNWSPAYTPPELTNGRPGPGTDQYSLAVTYYELRTGRLPFPDGSTPAGIAMRHAAGNLDFSSPLLHEHERRVLRWATASRPADRYSSCSDFIRQLEAAVRNLQSFDPSGKPIVPERAFAHGLSAGPDDEPPTQDIGEHVRMMLGQSPADPPEEPEQKTFDLPSDKNVALPEIELFTPISLPPPPPRPVALSAPTVEHVVSPAPESPVVDQTALQKLFNDSGQPLVVISEPRLPADKDLLPDLLRSTKAQPLDFVPNFDSKHPSLGVNGTTPPLHLPMPPLPPPLAVPGPFTESTDLVVQLAHEPIQPTPQDLYNPGRLPRDPDDPAGKRLRPAEIDSSLAKLLLTSNPHVPSPREPAPVVLTDPPPTPPRPTPRSGPQPRLPAQPPPPPPPVASPEQHENLDSKPSWFKVAERIRLETERKKQQEQLEKQDRKVRRITPGRGAENDEEAVPPVPASPKSGRLKPSSPEPVSPTPSDPLLSNLLGSVRGLWSRLWTPSTASERSSVQGSVPSTGDDVECTVFLPGRLLLGQSGLLQIFVHRPEDDPTEEAMQYDDLARSRGRQALAVEIPRKARLEVSVMLIGVELAETHNRIVWSGRSSPASFPLMIPGDAPIGNIPGKVTLSYNGDEVASISFLLSISPGSDSGIPGRAGNVRRNPSRPPGSGR